MALELINSLRRLASRSAVSHRGSVLLIALWSICLLTTFAVYLGYGVRQKIILIQRLDERDRLRFIAEAGIKKAAVQVSSREPQAYDALQDKWSNNPVEFKDIGLGGGSFSIRYDYTNEKTGVGETRYGLIDEERKININKATREVLGRLLSIVLGLDEIGAQELAASIIDWRDSDSELSIPLGSAEDPYYRNLQYSYEAKDAEFEVLDEVLLVKGMTEDRFMKTKDYITIYGEGKVNINTAPKAVLLALGLTEGIVDKIISFRYGEDNVLGSPDDNIFDEPSNIVPRLSQAFRLSDAEIAQLSIVVDRYLVAKSNNFMIRGIAQLNGRKNIAEAISIVNQYGKVLYWQAY